MWRRVVGLSPGAALRRIYLLWFYRAFARRKPLAALRYAVRGRETSNFTYDIANRRELASLTARALGGDEDDVLRLFAEIEGDRPFLDELEAGLLTRGDRNRRPLLGRRLVWYAAARIAQPEVAVETGTHDGLGSAVIGRALQRNGVEGRPGRLLTFDAEPASGWLVPASVRPLVDVQIGDVRTTLPQALADLRVGLFVHDSLHTYEHELFELGEVLRAAAPRIVLISDNAHASQALADFARDHGAAYHYAAEVPVEHFYPGAGVGIAVVSPR